MRLLTAIMLAFLLANGAAAHDERDKEKCTAIKAKIKTIQSKMRAGYTRAQGERMEAQLRKLKQQRRLKCR